MENIKNNIKAIEKSILLSQSTSLISSANVDIVAVCKNQSLESIEQVIKAGLTNFAENYVLEAKKKWEFLKAKYPHIRLHLIGHLQSNKIKLALELFDVIQSIDSLKLAHKITENNLYKEKIFFIQVNLDPLSTTKTGINIGELENLVHQCQNLSINVVGLMGIAPLNIKENMDPSPYFALLYKLNKSFGFKELSMGMSADYEIAIKFGATNVRIGSAIFANN